MWGAKATAKRVDGKKQLMIEHALNFMPTGDTL